MGHVGPTTKKIIAYKILADRLESSRAFTMLGNNIKLNLKKNNNFWECKVISSGSRYGLMAVSCMEENKG
jgi:hypothetical protein